jgi:hypothetical protein
MLVDLIDQHLADYPMVGADGPLFPGQTGEPQEGADALSAELARRSVALGIGFHVKFLDLKEACKDHIGNRGVSRVVLQALLRLKHPDETELIGCQPRLDTPKS